MTGQEDVNRYLREVIAEAEALRIPLGSIKPEVRINSRAKKDSAAAGRRKRLPVNSTKSSFRRRCLFVKKKRSKKFWHMRFCIAAAAARIMERNGKYTRTR